MNLSDLFFWTGAVNRTGLRNIRGDELAEQLGTQQHLGGAVGTSAPQVIPDDGAFHAFTGFDFVAYDDLGFANLPTGLQIPERDPPIERVQTWLGVVFAGGPAMNFTALQTVNGTGFLVVPVGLAGFSQSLNATVVGFQIYNGMGPGANIVDPSLAAGAIQTIESGVIIEPGPGPVSLGAFMMVWILK